MGQLIKFSVGQSKYDNQPEQHECVSAEDFFELLLSDRSPQKHLKYICGPFMTGGHDNPEKYPGEKTWRLKVLALPRCFLAFDVDECRSQEDFLLFREYCKKWQCLIYTTASHKPEAPRFRAIVMLSKELAPSECESLGRVIEQEFKMALGLEAFKFDESTYQSAQPVYTPLLQSEHWIFSGKLLEISDYQHLFNRKVASNFLIPTTQSITSTPIPVGGRNSALLSYVGRLRGAGFPEEMIRKFAGVLNDQYFEVPLADDEVESICLRYAHQVKENLATQALRSQEPQHFNWVSLVNRPIPTTAPPPRNYAFGRVITPGALAVLGGPGGVSKTMLAIQVCAAAACAKTLGGIQLAEGSSILLLGEEDDKERDRRLGGICSHFLYDHQRVQERVLCIGAAGVDIRLTQRVDANSYPTSLESNLIELGQQHAHRCGSDLSFIVVDHARLVVGGDPNNAEDVTQLTRVLTNIARKTGACVLLIAHSPKSVLSKTGDAINAADIAGSSAFVDNARSAFMAYGMREDEAKQHLVPAEERRNWVRLQNVKANYAASGEGWWFKRQVVSGWDIAVLEHKVLPSPAELVSKKRSSLRLKVIEELKRYPVSSRRSLRGRAGRAGVFGASERELMSEVDRMLDEGLLSRRPPSAEERKKWRLSGQVREVLVLNADI